MCLYVLAQICVYTNIHAYICLSVSVCITRIIKEKGSWTWEGKKGIQGKGKGRRYVNTVFI